MREKGKSRSRTTFWREEEGLCGITRRDGDYSSMQYSLVCLFLFFFQLCTANDWAIFFPFLCARMRTCIGRMMRDVLISYSLGVKYGKGDKLIGQWQWQWQWNQVHPDDRSSSLSSLPIHMLIETSLFFSFDLFMCTNQSTSYLLVWLNISNGVLSFLSFVSSIVFQPPLCLW